MSKSNLTSVAVETNVELKKDGEKLQKVLARMGLGSRRELEKVIDAGDVKVNGEVARLGTRVHPGDKIKFRGRPLATDADVDTRLLLYHKPVGEVCSRKDPEGRATIFEAMPKLKNGRWVSVGRLDFNTSGLMLLTTDGELANSLMHPSTQVEREYLVRVMGRVDDAMIERLKQGVELDDGPARFTDVQEGGDSDGINRFFYVVLSEGRNREVRRLWESQGVTVSRLKRVRYGDVFIPSKLKKGQWMELSQRDADVVYAMANMAPKKIYQPSKKAKEKQARRERKQARS